MQIFILAQIYGYGAIAIKIDVYPIALFTTVMIYVSVVRTRAACGPRTVFVWPTNAFCISYITQSQKDIVLGRHPFQVTRHWSSHQYATIRG